VTPPRSPVHTRYSDVTPPHHQDTTLTSPSPSDSPPPISPLSHSPRRQYTHSTPPLTSKPLPHTTTPHHTLPPRPLSTTPPKKPQTPLTKNKNLSLGKYTPPSHSLPFDVSLHCLEEHIHLEQQNLRHFHLPNTIAKIRQHTQAPLAPNPWQFERTQQAALHNSNLLKHYDFDTERATQHLHNTTLSYGSEFKPATVLEPLLQHHQHWPSFKAIVEDGVSYPLTPLSESDRLRDLEALTTRGNHKSAHTPENMAALHKAFDKEVRYEWAIPITPACI
jgi:hypothetical protein